MCDGPMLDLGVRRKDSLPGGLPAHMGDKGKRKGHRRAEGALWSRRGRGAGRRRPVGQ